MVVGTTDKGQIKDVNDYVSPTLHPCISCQTDLLTSGLVTEDLIIITAGADRDIYQVHSLGELSTMYRNGSVEDLQRDYQEGFGKKW